MERAAHTKAGREERARCGRGTRRGAGVGHLAGQRGCVRAMERHLDLMCRQGRATEGFKLGHVVTYYLYLES